MSYKSSCYICESMPCCCEESDKPKEECKNCGGKKFVFPNGSGQDSEPCVFCNPTPIKTKPVERELEETRGTGLPEIEKITTIPNLESIKNKDLYDWILDISHKFNQLLSTKGKEVRR